MAVGGFSAVVAVLLAVSVTWDRWVLAGLLLAVQVGFIAAWVTLLEIPGMVGAVGIPTAAAAASDAVLTAGHHATLNNLAIILAMAFLLGFVWQIARQDRSRVTESLAATMSAAVLAVSGAAYLTLRAGTDGIDATTVALLGVMAMLGIGRVVDAVAPLPTIAGARRRGLPGLIAGLVVALVVGAFYGSRGGTVSTAHAALIALVSAAVAAVTDLGVELGFTTLYEVPRRPDPWLARLGVGTLLPILVAAPAAYVTARVVLS